MYIICTLAKDEALAAGCQDALMHDYKGRLSEATGANLFLLIGGELHTPTTETILNGITRQTVMELARKRGLKVIEKASRYHREHHERSYPTRRLLRWVRESGGTVVHQEFGGLVPMFCPDWVARTAKALEPRVERSPLLRYLGCAVLVVVARRGTHPGEA